MKQHISLQSIRMFGTMTTLFLLLQMAAKTILIPMSDCNALLKASSYQFSKLQESFCRERGMHVQQKY